MTLNPFKKATQTEIARAVKAVKSTGLSIARVEIEGAKITILTGPPEQSLAPRSIVNDWRERKNARAAEGH